ncbi:MAG: zinc ribbon domain-containing protein [Ignavibacteriae bacterium]|nr:zinc ribbon domain-containing protein [Ignavibacteriota bacterium]
MPVYEYKCRKCEREFEVTQRITEEPLKKCILDGCDGEVFRKISKNVGLVFNGSGFYLTDYVHKNNNFNTSKPKKDNGTAKETKKETTTKKADTAEAKT